ncbi:hypothetical protein SAMN04488598_1685 [Halanaerobium congolense]|jgi:phage tail tape-measure protein|uniref:Uncharacterized protein n=1 Tax=Halanaerobium congolense TaxID=54121 RepID=A0A1I0D257_9FIRM|nr:hypothetical protein [Halanaerobium congolense]PTX14776.1 hypothetical protein C7953_2837 [Halanaerobium congolense]SDG23912.1 hypothetical protein SAMN04488598_1685 [Halanaerobium congolense]SET26021.1 hypothetical protein SAMN04515652_15311 [Halanaerobium congolense]SFP77266.1 hypothetical protein SAMN04488596_15711 [Halanaerobium congolense]
MEELIERKLVDKTIKTGTTGGGMLAGGAGGAVLGTAICPGFGTAVGYLIGSASGTAAGYKMGSSLSNKIN